MKQLYINQTINLNKIKNPSGLIIVYNCVVEGDFEIYCRLRYPFSITFIDTTFNGKVFLNLNLTGDDSSIHFHKCTFEKDFEVDCTAGIGVAVNLTFNKFKGRIISNFFKLIIFPDPNLLIAYKNRTGYKLEYSNIDEISKLEFAFEDIYPKLKVNNIPQYLSFDNDPALKVGCEATACAIALAYILNKKITKNEVASFMKKDMSMTESFWEYFMGDIYEHGYGCMSPVSVDTIKAYLDANNIHDYEVINYTGTPLVEILQFLKLNIPIIVFATMSNEKMMYKVKYGSTEFACGDYWPGNDHSLVIVGSDFNKEEIYLADPEENSEEIRTRNIYQFINRYQEIYTQAIIIKKKQRD